MTDKQAKANWGLFDELEALRQERDAAFILGFDKGAIWGMKIAKMLDESADLFKAFPPELIRSFADMMHRDASGVCIRVAESLAEVREKAKGVE